MKRTIGTNLALAAALSVALTGCVIEAHPHDHDDVEYYEVVEVGDLTFYWDYEGLDCVEAGINRTLVEVYDGDHLVAEQMVPCDAVGVTFEEMDEGSYEYFISGIAPSGHVLYEAEGWAQVYGGENSYDVHLGFVGW